MSKLVRSSQEPWATFLNEVEGAQKALNCYGVDQGEAWFRGHTRSDYKLLPSLFRAYSPIETEEEMWEVVAKESDLFWEFSARARELHGVLDDDWDILFAMQHYGTPTRLLDWTESLAVAVYFATLGVEATDAKKGIPPPCIWVLNPYELNRISWYNGKGEPDLVAPVNLGWDPKGWEYYTYSELLSTMEMDWDKPVAIYPRQKNARLHAQQAWFTIHGDDGAPLGHVKKNKEFLRRIELDFSAIPAAKGFLKIAGINPYLLFADLESLSLHLQERNGLMSRSQAEEKLQARNRRRDVISTKQLQ